MWKSLHQILKARLTSSDDGVKHREGGTWEDEVMGGGESGLKRPQ